MGFNEELVKYSNVKILFGEPMKKHTSFGVGGKTDSYIEVDSVFTLNEVLLLAKHYKIPFKIIGNGTNVLVSDKGYKGLIIRLNKLNSIIKKTNHIKVMAGANVSSLISFSFLESLSGLEWLVGIPGTIGGAVVMNAGAFGHSISDRIVSVEALVDGKIKRLNKNDCKFGYRSSRFLKNKEIVLSATFCLLDGDKEFVLDRIKGYKELRQKVQPTGRSCGSVFKNPLGEKAGSLIERSGLKGYKIGGARVSFKHANFIIAEGKTNASDIASLIAHVKEKVKGQFGIELEEELEYIGDF